MSHTFIFLKKETISVEVFLKTEKEFNKEKLAMSKINENNEFYCSKMRSTSGQSDRLYGLTKVHKDKAETSLRPVISLPGSSYENLKKKLAKLFDKIDGADIETNS